MAESFSPEARATQALAGVRRQSAELKRTLLKLPQIATSDIIPILREADGTAIVEKSVAEHELVEKEAVLKERATHFAAATPRYAAYLLAYTAKLKQMVDAPYDSELSDATTLLTRAANIAPTKSDDLLPSAILLGIARRAAEDTGIPASSSLARVIQEHEHLLHDIALVLPESGRDSFVSSLPETHRVRYSAQMDKALSTVLNKKIIESDADIAQAERVQSRAQAALGDALAAPQKELIPTVKALAQTLAELDSEEGARLLAKLGVEGLKGGKSLAQERWKVSKVARILKTLSDIDVNKGGMLAMKFLAKSSVPPRLFTFFCTKLMQNGYLTAKLMPYLARSTSLPFLRELIQKHPGQFNTVIETLAQIPGYDPAENPREVFDALQDLDTLTPIIFDEYCKAPDKKEFARQVRETVRDFFRNTPISNILPKNKQRILAEMVYCAYKPHNMSFEKVQALMRNLDDRTEDISDYSFPDAGYDFSLTTSREITLRDGELLDLSRLRAYRNTLSHSYPDEEEGMQRFAALLEGFAKGGALNPRDELEYESGLGTLASIMSRDEIVQNFLRSHTSVSEARAYEYMAELEEFWNIYFRDNYAERLGNFLGANPTVEGKLAKILTNPARQEVLKKRLGDSARDIAWDKLSSRDEIARLLTLYVSASMLKTVRTDINKQLKKFDSRRGIVTGSRVHNLKAYVSKNIGSFFAKASAGICTAEDISLWNDESHFHFNIIENDELVRANIQAYIINVGGRKALLLRGFNPTSDFLKRIDAAAFCEQTLEIAREFQRANNLAGVYISEQGSWHALSNREQVGNYLVSKYHRAGNRAVHSLKVASTHTISHIYKV